MYTKNLYNQNNLELIHEETKISIEYTRKYRNETKCMKTFSILNVGIQMPEARRMYLHGLGRVCLPFGKIQN